LRFRHGDGIDMQSGIVDGIEDKVTQDIGQLEFFVYRLDCSSHCQLYAFSDDSEGTGVWTLREIAGRHVPAPTIAAAHQLRLTSATRRSRLKVHDVLKLPVPKMLAKDASFDKDEFVKDLKLAVYAGILGAYVQGMNVGHAWSTWLGDIH
jgi:6-phosphogluconate dehydrogenase